MLGTYKFRIYPNGKQKKKIEETIETCRRLYNDFLYERKYMYEYDGTNITYRWQQDSLPSRRRLNPYLQNIHSQVLQDVAHRVDRAFKNFFRRVRKGETPGYPRFKGRGQYRSITYPQSGYKVEGDRLVLSCLGSVKIKLHREIDGRIKTCSIVERNGKYYACFSSEVEVLYTGGTGKAVGIDMGLIHFCITSDGEFYNSPKTYRRTEKALKKQQRKVSRRKKGSNRRRKAVRELALMHEKVANQRRDIAHKVAKGLLEKYDTIAHENLEIRNMVRNGKLSKSIIDAGWGIFFNILAYKAESAGRQILRTDPKNTSQECFACGNKVPKKLSERWHNCPYCGYSEHRDINAARNILKRAIA